MNVFSERLTERRTFPKSKQDIVSGGRWRDADVRWRTSSDNRHRFRMLERTLKKHPPITDL